MYYKQNNVPDWTEMKESVPITELMGRQRDLKVSLIQSWKNCFSSGLKFFL